MKVRRVVTTRSGGVSNAPYDSFNLGDHVGDAGDAVVANRARLARELGMAADRIVWMEQVHGRTAQIVAGPRERAVPATDALITAQPRLALAVLVADCVPVLLADPLAGVLAAVHAGRVGARVGVLDAALQAMVEAGGSVHRVEALLGPAICGACYEVPASMRDEVAARLPGSASTTRKGTPGLDVRAGLWEQLSAAGIAKIGVDPRCTLEDRSLYSYRRDGTTGRMAALTWIEDR